MVTSLGAGREFDRIRAIVRALGGQAPEVGDDCAFVAFGDQVLALSTDTSVESIHFRRAWATLEEIGWRAAAGALSDLAAVAAEPIGLLAALVLPPGLGEEDTVALMRGVADAGASVGAVVLGGDLSAGGELVITITVVGRCERPVRRSGARPGDRLWVTGRLGGARAALEAWISGGAPAAAARAAFLHPEARVGAARWLASHGATAMIDLSDGLAGDAGHLAAASGVRLEIDLARIPLHPDLAAVTAAAGAPAVELAARGGEDYELLVAMPPDFGDAVAALAGEEVGVGLTRIGAVVPGSGVRLSLDGRDVALTSYDHFA